MILMADVVSTAATRTNAAQKWHLTPLSTALPILLQLDLYPRQRALGAARLGSSLMESDRLSDGVQVEKLATSSNCDWYGIRVQLLWDRKQSIYEVPVVLEPVMRRGGASGWAGASARRAMP